MLDLYGNDRRIAECNVRAQVNVENRYEVDHTLGLGERATWGRSRRGEEGKQNAGGEWDTEATFPLPQFKRGYIYT